MVNIIGAVATSLIPSRYYSSAANIEPCSYSIERKKRFKLHVQLNSTMRSMLYEQSWMFVALLVLRWYRSTVENVAVLKVIIGMELLC